MKTVVNILRLTGALLILLVEIAAIVTTKTANNKRFMIFTFYCWHKYEKIKCVERR